MTLIFSTNLNLDTNVCRYKEYLFFLKKIVVIKTNIENNKIIFYYFICFIFILVYIISLFYWIRYYLIHIFFSILFIVLTIVFWIYLETTGASNPKSEVQHKICVTFNQRCSTRFVQHLMFSMMISKLVFTGKRYF